VSNDLNPTFDETFVLDVMSTELQCVWIRVFDDDGDYNAHDVMGTVVLPLAGLPSKEDVRGEYALKSTAELDGAAATKSRGFVELALRYEPVEEEGSSLGASFEKNNGNNGAEEETNKNKKDAKDAFAGDSVPTLLPRRRSSEMSRDGSACATLRDDKTPRRRSRRCYARTTGR
jgi:hypothetical protein